MVLDEFHGHLASRLKEQIDVDSKRVAKLAEHLLLACIAATAGAFEVAREVNRLRPVELDLEAMAEYLRDNIEPRSACEALVRMAEGIADPDDEFGNEILNLP